MRFYSFTNMYTSGIHAGIQSAHAVHEMMTKYMARQDDPKYKRFLDWAHNHKTMIVKQAGYHSSLNSLYDELKESSAWLELPMVKWRESQEALNGATTAIGIVVPAEVYTIPPSALFRTDNSAQHKLASIINRYPMAN